MRHHGALHRGAPCCDATLFGSACASATVLGLASAQALGAWTAAGSGAGIDTAVAEGGLLLLCSASGAPEADVGPYGLAPDTEYVLTFEAERVEALELLARVGPATAVVVTGDAAAALTAFLQEAPTTTVTMELARLRLAGGPLAFAVPTFGFPAALAELPCGAR